MSERFKVDLSGIIDLASNHMYTTSEVFVRELIQNAVDAVTARRQVDPEFAGSIRVEVIPGGAGQASRLSVVDNGIGLTQAEVHEFLSTVGGSSKRNDAEDVVDRASAGFLGKFGIGLLSCFMVTDEIVVVTKSAKDPGSRLVEWRGRTDGSYVVAESEGSGAPVGTSVYVTSKEGVEDLFEVERVIELARKYAQMLSIPIVVASGAHETCINRRLPTWQLSCEADGFELEEYCQEALGFRPMDVFRIEAPAGLVRGHLFIRPTRGEAWSQSHHVYANGMFVSEQVFGLLPRWASFVGACMDSGGLRLTASREGLHHDESLEKTSDQIGSAIRQRLVHLLRTQPQKFDAIMGVHDTEIRGLAVQDSEFYTVIIDLLEFETTLGRIRFGEFRREHERLLVARTAEQYRRLQPIASVLGIRVFNGGFTYHEELLGLAAQRFPDLSVVGFDTSDLVMSLPEPDDADRFSAVVEEANEMLEPRDCRCVVREFEPTSVSAMFALGMDAEYHRQLDRTKAMSSELWQKMLESMAPRPQTLNPTCLCLNSRNDVVRRVAGLGDRQAVRAAVEVLYVQALMSGQHSLTSAEIEMLNRGMEFLLTRAIR